MSRAQGSRLRVLVIVACVAGVTGCARSPTQPGAGPAAPASAFAAKMDSHPTLPPTETDRAEASGASTTPYLTSAAPVVRVTALGNMFIRRGPDLAFNSISLLPMGTTATASGRDALSHWLRISLPDDPSSSGWISIMSKFTQVRGEVDSLPAIEPREWPDLAFIRNCTYHDMILEPGGLELPAVQNFPYNDVRVDPGMYRVVDVEVEGYPDVVSLEIREGESIDVLVDGTGAKRKCPES